MMRTAVLAFATVAPGVALVVFWGHPVTALSIVFLSHMLMLWPTLVPRSQWWGPVVTRFQTDRSEVWLTIDDGPDPAHTPKMLDILERYNAKATFFVVGDRVKRFPDLARQIVERGHRLANHTSTHPSGSFWCAGPKQIGAEIERCASAVHEAGATMDPYFRAPAGLKNFFVHRVAERRNLALVAWTARGFDTMASNPANVASAIDRKIQPGGIVLLHEAHRVSTDPAFHLECLELTLGGLTGRGFSFVIPSPEQLQFKPFA